MTNVLATNAVVPKSIETPYYLKASKQGFPISGQVPRTYQVYTGTGGTIDYDGSNEIRIFGQILTSPLIINFGPLQRIRDMVGRLVTINIIAPISQTVTLNSSPAFMVINGTALQQLSHVIPGDNLSKSITIYFHSTQYINIDYGAAAASAVSPISFANIGIGEGIYYNTVGSTINLRSIDDGDRTVSLSTAGGTINVGSRLVVGGNGAEQYFYGNSLVQSAGGALQLYNPVGDSINVTTPFSSGLYSGGYFSITTPSVVGNNPIYDIAWTPPPRMNRPMSVGVNFYRGLTDLVGCTRLDMIPKMQNVFEKEYVMACRGGDTNAIYMYDPDSASPSELFANIVDTVTITPVVLQESPIALATDLQDNLIFYVPEGDKHLIKVATTSLNQFYGSFTDIVVIDTNSIAGGVFEIADLCYNEVTSTLYALPTNVNGRIIAVQIHPKLYDPVNFPVVSIGPVHTIPFDGIFPGADDGLYSICLLNNDGDFLIAYDDGITKLGVFRIDAQSYSIKHLYTLDIGAVGPISIMMGSRGRVIAQYSIDRTFYVSTVGCSIMEGLTATHHAPSFYPSLTVNCYNYEPLP